jgi:hypothetical protein
VKKPNTVNTQTALNRYTGFHVPVRAVQADLTGVTWQGIMRLDQDACTFDAVATQFVEQTPATSVTWDQNETIWDSQVTTFDRSWYIRYPQFSNMIFDQDRTQFDYYATLFDTLPVTTSSAWNTTWVWFMGTHA